MRPRMPLPILVPRGEPVRPRRIIPAPESRNPSPPHRGKPSWLPWVGPLTLSKMRRGVSEVEGSQERNGWAALLPCRGDRPVAFPGAEGPLTLSPVEGSSGGAAHNRKSVASALPQPTPFSPVIPRPREESNAHLTPNALIQYQTDNLHNHTAQGEEDCGSSNDSRKPIIL